MKDFLIYAFLVLMLLSFINCDNTPILDSMSIQDTVYILFSSQGTKLSLNGGYNFYSINNDLENSISIENVMNIENGDDYLIFNFDMSEYNEGDPDDPDDDYYNEIRGMAWVNNPDSLLAALNNDLSSINYFTFSDLDLPDNKTINEVVYTYYSHEAARIFLFGNFTSTDYESSPDILMFSNSDPGNINSESATFMRYNDSCSSIFSGNQSRDHNLVDQDSSFYIAYNSDMLCGWDVDQSYFYNMIVNSDVYTLTDSSTIIEVICPEDNDCFLITNEFVGTFNPASSEDNPLNYNSDDGTYSYNIALTAFEDIALDNDLVWASLKNQNEIYIGDENNNIYIIHLDQNLSVSQIQWNFTSLTIMDAFFDDRNGRIVVGCNWHYNKSSEDGTNDPNDAPLTYVSPDDGENFYPSNFTAYIDQYAREQEYFVYKIQYLDWTLYSDLYRNILKIYD